MTVKTLIASMFMLFWLEVTGQFNDDFNQPGDLFQTSWKGDLQNFKLNDSGQLQLNAPEAGSSSVYHKTNLPDSLEWNFYFKMDFSPSANNKLRIYLQLDTVEPALASGYFIEIGENGSEDKIRFSRMVNGVSLTIAEGTPGLFGSEPAEGYIRVKRNAFGLWQVYYKKVEDPFYELDFELFDSTVKRYFDQFFMVECVYTSTRRSHFYFDDISVSESVPDKTPPGLLEGKLLTTTSVELIFDEILDKTSVLQTATYEVNPGKVAPVAVGFNPFRPNRITLQFEEEFSGNTQFVLLVNGLSDLSGNTVMNPLEYVFYIRENPEFQDILINEVLFDPYPEAEDFVELYNHSAKIINLKGLILKNNKSSSLPQKISVNYDLFPGKYVAVSPDTNSLRFFYPLPDSARVLINTLPSFNNDKGNVSLYFEEGNRMVLIDSVDYHEEMHFPLIEDSEGVSLERIFWHIPGYNVSNWQSGSGITGNATPGYRNAQFRVKGLEAESMFWLGEAVFSPDQDGFFDQLVIRYELPEDGWVGTLEVFSVSGQHIRTLVNNKLLGTSGMVTWDGLSEGGNILPVSPYVISARIFHPSGKTYRKKLVCMLAEKF